MERCKFRIPAFVKLTAMLAVPDSALVVFAAAVADSLSDSDFEQADKNKRLNKNNSDAFVKSLFEIVVTLLFLSIIGAKGEGYCSFHRKGTFSQVHGMCMALNKSTHFSIAWPTFPFRQRATPTLFLDCRGTGKITGQCFVD